MGLEEYVDIVDENNNLTGRFTKRENLDKYGYWHRIIIAWVINEEGKILFQKRAAVKKYAPNIWSITGGQIIKGESAFEGLKRELNEELGIDITKNDAKLIDIYITKHIDGDKKTNRFIYEYLCKTNLKENQFVLQEDEVSDVKYLTYEEILDIQKDDNLSKNYSKDIFAIEKIKKYLNT